MSSCSTRCISFTPSHHEQLPCLRYCGDDDDLLNDDDSDMEDMAFDDNECNDCISCVGDDCCDEVSCDGSSVHDKVGDGDDGKVDHTVFDAVDNNLLWRRRQYDDGGCCSVDSDDDDCVDNALSFS